MIGVRHLAAEAASPVLLLVHVLEERPRVRRARNDTDFGSPLKYWMSAIAASCRALARVRRFYAVRRARLLVRRTADGGRRYTARNAALNRRMLAKPAANAIAEIGIAVSSKSVLAR